MARAAACALLAAAVLLLLRPAVAVGPGSAMDAWMASMMAKAPKLAAFNNTPLQTSYLKTTRVRGCSYSSSYATRGGSSVTSNLMKARTFNLAAHTCSHAVGDALSDACNATNAAGRLSAASTACANALAGVFVSQLSAASSSDNARACSMGCAFAETGGMALASSVGNAVMAVAGKCGAVASWVSSGQLSAAFVDITSAALTRACTDGRGVAANQGALMSKAVAQALSKVLVSVAAKACSCGDVCSCPPLPDGLEYDDVAYSDSVGRVVAGQLAAQQTVADAAGLLCDGQGVQAAAQKVLEVTTKTMVDGVQEMTTLSMSDGSGEACGLMLSHQAALSMAMASTQVLANAFVANFNSTCGGGAFAAVTGLAKSSDVGLWLVDRLKISCNKAGRNFTRAFVNDMLKDSPLGDAVHDALQGVFTNCGCEGRCWCGTPSDTCNPARTCPAYQLAAADIAQGSGGVPHGSRRLLHAGWRGLL